MDQRTTKRSSPQPPVLEVAVSHDEEEEKSELAFGSPPRVAPAEGQNPSPTRIYISPHRISASPQKGLSDSDLATTSVSVANDDFEVDESPDVATAKKRSIPLDAEENCLISDIGVVSRHGKIHYPSSWNKAGIRPDGSGRDLALTLPYNSSSDGVISQNQSGSSDRWGSETVNFNEEFSTGNKDRDDVMARARAILAQHQFDDTDEIPEMKDSTDNLDDDDRTVNEDGLAPLGGDWPEASQKRMSTREMLQDPMKNLRSIHIEAGSLLKVRFGDGGRLTVHT